MFSGGSLLPGCTVLTSVSGVFDFLLLYIWIPLSAGIHISIALQYIPLSLAKHIVYFRRGKNLTNSVRGRGSLHHTKYKKWCDKIIYI